MILILLAATYAAAQEPTLADYARRERARQLEVQNKVQNKNIKVYTTEDIRTTLPATEVGDAKPAGDVAAETAAAPGAPGGPAAATATTVQPPVDPVQQWLLETEKLRALIRELMDREVNTQLEINRITNDVYSPDTNETAVARAQAALGVAQQKLSDIREQLAKSRLELQKREQEGPPRKQP